MKQTAISFTGRIYRRFLKIRGTPKEISLGFALGIFIGFSPTMGIQIAMAVFLSSLLKWSKITAALGVQITNPVTAPFVYGFTYYVGARILGLENPFSLSHLMSVDSLLETMQQAPRIFAALTIGGILTGLPLAVISYMVVFHILDRYHETVKTSLRNKTRKIRQQIIRPRPGRKRNKKK